MHCIYRGNFEDKHEAKKRPAKEKTVISLTKNYKSSETYREIEGNRLLKIGILSLIFFKF